jgi:hypothetical protein
MYIMTYNWDTSSQWCPHQPPVVQASSAARHSEVGAMVSGQQTLLQQLWHCGTAKPGLENFHEIISRNNHYEKNSFWWYIYIYNLSSVNYLSIGTTGNMVNVRSSECHFKNVYIYSIYFKSWCLILTGIMLLWTTEVNYQWGGKKRCFLSALCSIVPKDLRWCRTCSTTWGCLNGL